MMRVDFKQSIPLDFSIRNIDIQMEACKRSLAVYTREAWPVLEPGTDYIYGWHIGFLCEHLQAVTDGQITRLLINVPPGTMKSLLTSVIFPSWEWGPRGLSHYRYISASHAADLATRDTLKMRRLVTSNWFQSRWPIKLAPDQNEKKYFENRMTGFRQSCAVGSMTGRRGHRVIWDDPHSVEGALSAPLRERDLRVFTETLPTRLDDPKKSAIIIIMQRLHEKDVSGYILAEKLGYVHIMLPMEYEPDRKCITIIGSDPRTKEGELLFPERFPAEVVAADKKVMGTIAISGQYQQRPVPRGGAFFEWQNMIRVKELPEMVKTVRYWDKAGTEDGGKRTAGVKLGIDKDNRIFVMDVVKGQWAAANREKAIRATAQADGVKVKIWIEQEGGSGGKESAENTITKTLLGFSCRADSPKGDKELRAEPLAVQVEAANLYVLDTDWTNDFIDEFKVFPRGQFKDQVDATSGAFSKLTKRGPIGVLR